jgi:exopolysaccharide biosynthesis polyprenyl glycosylphosphotransferase
MAARGEESVSERNRIETPARPGPGDGIERRIPPAPTEMPQSWPPTPTTPRNGQGWWLRFGVRPYLILIDIVAFGVAAAITLPTRRAHLLVLLVNLVTFSLAGLYRSRLTLSVLADVPYIAAGLFVGFALKAGFLGFEPGVPSLSRQVLHAAVLFATVTVFRAIAYEVVREARSRGLVRHRTLIVGAGHVGSRLAMTLVECPRYGLDPVGLVDSRSPQHDPALLPVPVLGGYDRLGDLIREHHVRDVIVAFGGARESDLVDILRSCDRLDVEVFLVPRLFELHANPRHMDELNGIPLIRTRRAAFRSPMWRVKRLVDIVVSAIALVLLSPVLAVCALLVRRELGSPIIFRQERVGLDGRPFQLLKFRSLRPADETESRTNWNIKHDHRLGPVGRFLRATSLDELPQLWNILRGDMSLVGPRPERPHFVDEFSRHIPRYTARHRVPAGLTGWSQVHGLRGDTSIEERARFDNYYIENWSAWLDFKILLMTLTHVVRKTGG